MERRLEGGAWGPFSCTSLRASFWLGWRQLGCLETDVLLYPSLFCTLLERERLARHCATWEEEIRHPRCQEMKALRLREVRKLSMQHSQHGDGEQIQRSMISVWVWRAPKTQVFPACSWFSSSTSLHTFCFTSTEKFHLHVKYAQLFDTIRLCCALQRLWM